MEAPATEAHRDQWHPQPCGQETPASTWPWLQDRPRLPPNPCTSPTHTPMKWLPTPTISCGIRCLMVAWECTCASLVCASGHICGFL